MVIHVISSRRSNRLLGFQAIYDTPLLDVQSVWSLAERRARELTHPDLLPRRLSSKDASRVRAWVRLRPVRYAPC